MRGLAANTQNIVAASLLALASAAMGAPGVASAQSTTVGWVAWDGRVTPVALTHDLVARMIAPGDGGIDAWGSGSIGVELRFNKDEAEVCRSIVEQAAVHITQELARNLPLTFHRAAPSSRPSMIFDFRTGQFESDQALRFHDPSNLEVVRKFQFGNFLTQIVIRNVDTRELVVGYVRDSTTCKSARENDLDVSRMTGEFRFHMVNLLLPAQFRRVIGITNNPSEFHFAVLRLLYEASVKPGTQLNQVRQILRQRVPH